MSATEPSFLTLSQVALRTGRHPELLRQWCAAGRIPCKRVGGSWVLREEDLPMVAAIARRGHGTRSDTTSAAPDPDRTRIIAAVFDGDDTAHAVADALRERLHMTADAVGMTNLGINGLAALRLTVVAGRFAEPASVDARRILVGYGGRIVADIDETAAGDGEMQFNASRRRRAAIVDDRRDPTKAPPDGTNAARRSPPPATTR